MVREYSCGRDYNSVNDIAECFQESSADGFGFISVPLAHPRYNRNLINDNRNEPFTRSDMLLNSTQWTTYVVGKISEWFNLDSPNATIRTKGEKAFKQEMAWSTHLSLPAVLLPSPKKFAPNYANLVNSTIKNIAYSQFWLRIPLVAEILQPADARTFVELEKEVTTSQRPANDTWEWWNSFRTMCEHQPNLGIALEITADLPPADELRRWCSEPVKVAIIPTEIFINNEKGFPVLSKRHQAFVKLLIDYNVQFLLSGNPQNSFKMDLYYKYLGHLHTTLPELSPEEQFEAPYYDYLQAPLQPLMDNLESQTYETFERDPIKYDNYQEAIYQALLERTKETDETVLMVVGAGRGPLVRASITAAEASGRKIKIYAVEKNPNAVVTLRNMKVSLGWHQVTIVHQDMRYFEPEEKADILVSELLGSFGDNELSPECLDGAQRFLKEGGISIPSEYTSYIAPVQSSKLHTEVASYKDLEHFETGFVVKLHNFNQLGESQPCFTFVHPNPSNPINNDRQTTLSFPISQAATIHGFVGYFDATLYKDVHISINPQTFSDKMVSWFPLFWPLRHPMYAPKDSTIEVIFWRKSNTKQIWYEWGVTSPSVSPIHNPNGRSYWIGL